MPTARELKVQVKATRVRRGSSPVTVSYLPESSRVCRRVSAPPVAPLREPDELERQVRFVEMRPKDVHPWDWHQFYTVDETLWDAIAEVAVEAVEAGELQRYDRLR